MIMLLKPAQTELDEAYEYYESQMAGLGAEFIQEFEKAIKRIQQFPEAWHQFSQNTRRCQVSRFPYGIIYQIKDSDILIIAVAHLHRAPFYWANRK